MIGIPYEKVKVKNEVDRKNIINAIDNSISKWQKYIDAIEEEEEYDVDSIIQRCGLCLLYDSPMCKGVCPLNVKGEACYKKDPYAYLFNQVEDWPENEFEPDKEFNQQVLEYGTQLIEYLEGLTKYLEESE